MAIFVGGALFVFPGERHPFLGGNVFDVVFIYHYSGCHYCCLRRVRVNEKKQVASRRSSRTVFNFRRLQLGLLSLSFSPTGGRGSRLAVRVQGIGRLCKRKLQRSEE